MRLIRCFQSWKSAAPAQAPSGRRLAHQLGIEPATLRRRLHGEAQSVAALKDEIRDALARYCVMTTAA